MLPNAVLPPSLDHNYAQYQERESRLAVQPPLMKKIIPAPKSKSPWDPESPRPVLPPTSPATVLEHSMEQSPELPPPPGMDDNRQCTLCLKYGDNDPNDAGRLLYIGQDEWTHVNCALWSAEVFEDDDGSLKNVHMAVIRGKQLRCELCQKLGATVGCCLTSCTSNYHFLCARVKNCVFLEDKKVYCQKHRDLIKGEVVSGNGFEVLRRVFVDFDGISLRRKFLNGLEPDNIHLMIGSMTIDCLGILNDLSDCEEKLFPIGYQCSRVYWSTNDARKRCVYTCKILECRPPPSEPDINSTVQHEENRTIAHNPVTVPADIHESQNSEASKYIETHGFNSLDPLLDTSRLSRWVPLKSPVVSRIHTPRYSLNQRSPGSRPLPSAGSPSPVTHEIVTVGDPLLSSGLRSIGARRHSTPSPSPQQQKSCLNMATHIDLPRLSLSSPGTTLTSSSHSSSNAENVQSGDTTVMVKINHTPSNGHRTVGFKGENLAELRNSGALENITKNAPIKTDNAKSSATRLSDSFVHKPNLKISPKPQGMSCSETNTSQGGVMQDSLPALHNFKATLTTQYQRVTRREKDNRAKLSLTDKSVSLVEVKDLQSSLADPGNCMTKDTRSKAKKAGLENAKERHLNKSLSNPELRDNQKQPNTNGIHATSNAMCVRPHGKLADKSLSSKVNLQPENTLVIAGKGMQTKMGPDVEFEKAAEPLKPAPLSSITESRDSSKSLDVSDGKRAIMTNHTSLNTVSEPQAGNAYPCQDSNLLLQDGSKTQEDNSYKRRYPRRSARARSNMFFGLTPLYGVRSYGEEDLPFCSSTPGKKRAKRSAEGQVDGADDLSTSDEDELYYYNFTRTVVSSVDDRLGTHTLFREEDQRDQHEIPQLDGVDDGTESDASITVTVGKSNQGGKRNSKENGAEKMDVSGEQTEKVHVGKGNKTIDSKMENCHPVKQDTLEAQLSLDAPRRVHSGAEKNLLDTFNAELLKSDSDNNNSDDCGNILPIDIMDFVLKNTPSMQTLVESPESSSSELLTLGDGLGLDSNRGKDMGLFEVFSQQLPTSESGDGPVTSTMSAEEQFELPLELPSDLSVLTTRSPSLPSQNHGRLGVISESQLSSPGERSLLSVPTSDTGEKRVTVTDKPVTPNEGDQALLNQSVDRASEGHIAPDRFISGHMDTEHISSPPRGHVDHSASQDMGQNSGTASLQMPVSPSVPLQNQKYISNSSESSGPSQITNSSIQSTPPHLKSSTDKLVVVNQNMQPLYVLQTLPNGVTQKIQLTQPVSQGTSQLEGDVPVLGSIGGGLTLTTALNSALTSTFSPASKSLLQIPHHPHLQPFPSGPQPAFLPSLSNQPSGLLIGVQSSADPQLLVSEAGQRADLGSSPNSPVPSMNKKRQISRLHSRKNKKLAPSVSPATRHAPEVVSKMTLINFTPSQITGGLSNHPSLIDLSTLGNPAPHRIPNIIKRSKSGVMYFDQTPLLPQGVGTSSSVGTNSSVIGLETSQIPGLATGAPVLNVVSMQAAPSAPPVTGQVTLTTQGILSPPELSSISNFLIKTSPQGMGIQENHVGLQTSSAMLSQRPTNMSTTSSICVMPTSQPMGMTLTKTDPDSPYPLPAHVSRLLPSHPMIQHENSTGSVPRTLSLQSPPTETESKLNKATFIVSSPGLQTAKAPNPTPQKAKNKVKRQPTPSDKSNRKKHKTSHPAQTPSTTQVAEKEEKPKITIPTDNHKPKTDINDLKSPTQELPAKSPLHSGHLPIIPESDPTMEEQRSPEAKQDDLRQPADDDVGFSSPLMRWLEQEQSRQGSPPEPKPRTGLLFEISSDDGFQISAGTIEEAWKYLTDKVQEARSNARLKQLSFTGVNGLRMLGIIHDAIVFLVEQLYGANRCRNYKFRFHHPTGEEEPPLNPHGSARAEVHLRKSSFDMFNFLASKHRQPPEYKPNDEEEEEVQLKSARRATSMDLPMPMRFRHLKKTSKEAVGVYRSPIHGRGLFCRRNIDAGEMVIEYSGNVIRSTLTDKREKYYDGKGIGCYMFRIDESEVVDATMHGNAARFINHSCEPNCYSRVIPIDGQKHIVIFAMRKIYRGEELTYDYKFPIEDANNKLVCNCGTKKCRKFLN